MAMELFDTMSRRLQPVEPLEPGHVRLYTCGPTVYARAHIGNFRTFLFEDVLRRWLERRFDRVTHVMNLTDVEDKIIRNAMASGHSLEDETAPHIADFFADLDTLGIRRAHQYPRATAYIDQMVALIQRLGERGVTYTSDGNVYFRIAAFPGYGRLSGARPDSLVAGAGGRVDADEYAKEDVRDFALWKRATGDEPGWDSPLGRGRPGWHIECSAMSMALLGESFDIHCGGVDNIFPHHENEIAQSEAATGARFVTTWCHSAHLRIGGQKMAKSAGNFATLRDLIGSPDGDGDRPTVRPSVVRYALAATAHYRKPLTFGDDVLHMSTEAVDRLAAFRDRVRDLAADAGADVGANGADADAGAGGGSDADAEPEADADADADADVLPSAHADDAGFLPTADRGEPASHRDDTVGRQPIINIVERARGAFAAAMDSDLNLPEAMGEVFTAIRGINRLLDRGGASRAAREELQAFIAEVDDVVGVLALADRERGAGLDPESTRLLDARETARAARDWEASDRLRAELRRRGVVVEDTAQGQRWHRDG